MDDIPPRRTGNLVCQYCGLKKAGEYFDDGPTCPRCGSTSVTEEKTGEEGSA